MDRYIAIRAAEARADLMALAEPYAGECDSEWVPIEYYSPEPSRRASNALSEVTPHYHRPATHANPRHAPQGPCKCYNVRQALSLLPMADRPTPPAGVSARGWMVGTYMQGWVKANQQVYLQLRGGGYRLPEGDFSPTEATMQRMAADGNATLRLLLGTEWAFEADARAARKATEKAEKAAKKATCDRMAALRRRKAEKQAAKMAVLDRELAAMEAREARRAAFGSVHVD